MNQKQQVITLNANSGDILFDVHIGDTEPMQKNNVPVKTFREVELIFLCFGNKVGLNIKGDCNHEIFAMCKEMLDGNSVCSLASSFKWNYRNGSEIAEVLSKFPIPEHIINKLNAKEIDETIPKEYVHKKDQKNVILSSPEKEGGVCYFRGKSEIPEITVDHKSDHLDGIVLFEAVRQAGLACAHLGVVSLEGIMAILDVNINYSNFIELNRPYYIQAVPAVRERGGLSACAFSVVQDGVVSAKGYFTAFIYKNKEAYEKTRRKAAK